MSLHGGLYWFFRFTVLRALYWSVYGSWFVYNTVTIQQMKIAILSWRKVVFAVAMDCILVYNLWLYLRKLTILLQCWYVLRLQGVMSVFVAFVYKCGQQLLVWTERIVTLVVFKC